jgi:hypothetical protein
MRKFYIRCEPLNISCLKNNDELGTPLAKLFTTFVTGEAGKADWLPVTFIGAGVFSRHFCSIDAQDGIVITKQVKFMD